MHCHDCGEEIADRTKFCPECGASQTGGEAAGAPARGPADGAGEPVLELAPVFVPANALAVSVPLTVFFALWCGGFLGGFSKLGLSALGADVPGWLPFVGFGLLALAGTPLLSCAILRKTYARTRYHLFRDRLDYFEGFFNVEEKTIPLERVVEVNLRKGVLQRKHGLGTIVLSTPATGASARSGIRIHDVAGADEAYRVVRELVDAARSRDLRRAA